jgi:hypothetical protein
MVTAIGERKIAAAGLSDRVSARAVDFFSEPLPRAGVITMGMILHDWNLEKKMQLIRAAYDALPAGRAFAVIENLIDDARRENFFGLGMSLNILIEFGDAFDFTAADFFGWRREVGFRETEVIPLAGPAKALGRATEHRCQRRARGSKAIKSGLRNSPDVNRGSLKPNISCVKVCPPREPGRDLSLGFDLSLHITH